MICMYNDLDTSYTQNRELSWLEFNKRVLMEATSFDVPLYERLKFISIFTSNLEEFYMIRVGSLVDLNLLKKTVYDNKTGYIPQEQLDAIFANVPELYVLRDQIFYDLEKKFRKEGIYNLSIDELNDTEKKLVHEYYEKYIFPVLSPQIIDVHHPFPFLRSGVQYIVVEIKDESRPHNLFGLVPVPDNLSNYFKLPRYEENDPYKYVLTEKIIYYFIDELFDMYEIVSKGIISVTRNADLSGDDEALDEDDDYVIHMKNILKKRKRLQPVALEFKYNLSKNILNFLLDNLDLNFNQVFKTITPINMEYAYDLKDFINPDLIAKLSYEPFEPQKSANINRSKALIPQIFNRDIILLYPYEDIGQFIDLIKEAASDDNVVSIKITIYRLSKDSKLVKYLTKAAENGKNVTVFLELRARFDEQNNIDWSDVLINAGCDVMYGIENYKVHSKLCLITFKDGNKLKYITQIGTGNYNESTSKIYSDFSLMTSNYEIGLDAVNFFNDISISNLKGEYKHLLASPHTLRPCVINLIEKETAKGCEGKIVLKMNALTDRKIIDKLAEASQAGVHIQMIIRGITCLVPGIKGKTDNIEIISIVGRFLEHARIYKFGEGEEMNLYISSADLMTRNTKRRIEIATPIYDKEVQKHILNYLDIQLKDTKGARKINSDGKMEIIPLGEGKELCSSQEYLMDAAIKASKKQFFDKKTKTKPRMLRSRIKSKKEEKNPVKKEKKDNNISIINEKKEESFIDKIKGLFGF